MNYIIIDDNRTFAAALYKKLNESQECPKNSIVIPQDELSQTAESIKKELNNLPEPVILINVNLKINGCNRQDQKGIELIYWIRCALQLKSPIIVYGFLSFEKIIQSNLDKSYILCSLGVNYIQLPFDMPTILHHINTTKPLSNLQDINPFLLPRVNRLLSDEKHSMANKNGMSLMFEMTKVVYGFEDKDNVVVNTQFKSIVEYRNSLEWFILRQYYGWQKFTIPHNFDKYKLNNVNKKILLIDDKANEGWGKVISKMIYGVSDSTNIKYGWTDYGNFKKLKNVIKEFKPHLVLLDLRLRDERGKQNIEDLIGYQILKYLQQYFKGLPVIMFTATTNAETVKTLLNAGAKAVWTKPGLDEELGNAKILLRYKQLIDLVKDAFTVSMDFNNNDVEILRKKIRNLLDYYKYRNELVKPNDPLKQYTDIFIDTNVFDSSGKDFVPVLIKIYFLILTSNKVQYEYVINSGDMITINRTKICIPNAVMYEIFKLSMRIGGTGGYHQNLWKRSLIVYEVIRPFIENNPTKDKIKTEINSLNSNGEPLSFIKHPSEFYKHKISFNYHADDVIVKEISQILNNFEYQIGIPIEEKIGNGKKVFKNNMITIKDKLTNRKVLLITDDTKLTSRVQSLKVENNNKVEVWATDMFNNNSDLNKIIAEI